jgi:DNA-binding CsgD family transcriptional regulator
VKRPTRDTNRRPGREVLDLLAASDTPSLASDAGARIVFWNRAAERLLGRSAAETLGRPCYEVLAGRDVFGNRHCYENCPVQAMTRRGETVRQFELVVHPPAAGHQVARVNILRLPGERPGHHMLVHLLEPLDGDGPLARALRSRGATRTDEPPHQGEPPVPRWGTTRPPLTEREKQILGTLARGFQNKEIASELGISLATVRNHVHNILEKLEVHTRLEALSLAFRRGWVNLESRRRA